MQDNRRWTETEMLVGDAALAMNCLFREEIEEAKQKKKYIRVVRIFILRKRLIALLKGLTALKIKL